MNPAAWQLLFPHPRTRSTTTLARRGEPDVYIPHPAPNEDVGEDGDPSKMGSFLSLLKTLVVPAIISLILYLLISFVIVPTWKRYRSRYSNYLPMDTISTRTTSFRQQVQGAVAGLLVPSAWRARWGASRYATASAQDSHGSDFDDDEGEELYDVDDNRREALSLDARRGRYTEGRRLSRDLEEGFKDDSDDEDEILDDRQQPSNASR